MSVEPASEPVKHLFTVDEYEAMGAAGLFAPDQRLELIEGEVIEMAPIGPLHAGTVARLNQVLTRAVENRAFVWVQNPVRLSDISEPQPDLALLRPRDDFYTRAYPRPEDVLLAVEVADTTRRWDRSVKVPLCARTAISELWLVDVQDRTVEVFSSAAGGDYTRMRRAAVGDSIVVPGLADLTVLVADFLA